MLIDLAGRSALVTGSTGGIGRGIVDALEIAGAEALVHGLEVPANWPCEKPILCADLTDLDEVLNLAERTFKIAPGLDILVCNAGSFFDAPFLDMTSQAWTQTMELNVRAPYFLIQAFARRLSSENRGGAVVIVGSTNGFQAETDSSAYDTSKGALVMLTRSLALNLAPYGIRVNCLAPGLIRTPLTERWLDQQPVMRAHYEKNIPLGRIGMPGDCGGAAAFLASDAAAYITGQVLVVDGGLTISQIGPL